MLDESRVINRSLLNSGIYDELLGSFYQILGKELEALYRLDTPMKVTVSHPPKNNEYLVAIHVLVGSDNPKEADMYIIRTITQEDLRYGTEESIKHLVAEFGYVYNTLGAVLGTVEVDHTSISLDPDKRRVSITYTNPIVSSFVHY